MNEKIKELAEQAGLVCESNGSLYALTNDLDCLERFAELIRQDEREVIAKKFDALAEKATSSKDLVYLNHTAAAIRGRTE